MIQQSLYIVHGGLTGMCSGGGGALRSRIISRMYQQGSLYPFTLRLNVDKVYTVLISDQKQAKNP